MNLSTVLSLEKSLAVAGLAALGLSAGWWWQQQLPLRRLHAERVGAPLVGKPYERAVVPAAAEPVGAWTKPVAQSSGGGWIYELFTPPVIYYHTLAKTFTVTPPLHFADKANLPFGLELLDVRREPFRLQLVGYVGASGDYIGTFVSEQLPQTLLGRSGARFAPLGLELKSLEIRRVNVAPRDATPVYDVAGFAVLRDERDGSEVTLDTRAAKLTDTPLAVLRVIDESQGKPRVLHEGDTFQQADATFRIERIQLDPPEVVVAKQTAGLPYPETRVLKPESTAAAGSKDSATARKFVPAARSHQANHAASSR